jgi:hypothetical protein
MFSTVTSASTFGARTFIPGSGSRPVEISLARTRSDLIAAFRLLYNSYVRAGLVSENDQKLRLTPYHLLPTTEVFVAKCGGDVISTLTMVADSEMGLPLESMYGGEVAELRRTGLVLAEMGCLADRRESPARFMKVFSQLARLVVQVAEVRGINALVAATHPRHARFYIRSLGFRKFGELQSCPYAEGNPAVALVQEFAALRGTRLEERLFGNPFSPERLIRTHWEPATRQYLQSLVHPHDRATAAGARRPR